MSWLARSLFKLWWLWMFMTAYAQIINSDLCFCNIVHPTITVQFHINQISRRGNFRLDLFIRKRKGGGGGGKCLSIIYPLFICLVPDLFINLSYCCACAHDSCIKTEPFFFLSKHHLDPWAVFIAGQMFSWVRVFMLRTLYNIVQTITEKTHTLRTEWYDFLLVISVATWLFFRAPSGRIWRHVLLFLSPLCIVSLASHQKAHINQDLFVYYLEVLSKATFIADMRPDAGTINNLVED